MQEQRVEALRPNRSGRTAILCVLAHAHGPLAIAACASHYRQFQGSGLATAESRKFCTATMPSPVRGANQCNRRPQLTRQRKHIHMAALLAQLVGHVQQHQRGRAQRNNARRQHQVAVQIGGIQNQDDGVRTRCAGHLSGQHIDRDFLVFGLGRETVNARQVDERDLVPLGIAHVAGVMFDGNAGKIADLLAQTGEAVEQRGLAGIGRANDGDRSVGCAERLVTGSRYRMAAHRRGAHALVSKGRCAEQLHMDVARHVAAHGNFGSLDAIHPRIAARAAARDRDLQTGDRFRGS